MSEKIQKVMARAGFGSRRQMEEWIEAGRVSVNGKLATLGDRIEAGDLLRVDGKVVDAQRREGGKRRVIAYHKPVGEVCSRADPEGRTTIFDNLPKLRNGRWVAVGRLDINTSGLILLTTDGELANRLMHPSNNVEREYAVRVMGEVDPAMIARLKSGVLLEDGEGAFDSIVDVGGEGANHWYHVTLKEGRNREVRRLWESQGVVVSRLQRVRYGPILLKRRLRPGHSEYLSASEVAALSGAVGLPGDQEAPPAEGRGPKPYKGRGQGRGRGQDRERAQERVRGQGRESGSDRAPGQGRGRGQDQGHGPTRSERRPAGPRGGRNTDAASRRRRPPGK